jgi:hypothetical protein
LGQREEACSEVELDSQINEAEKQKSRKVERSKGRKVEMQKYRNAEMQKWEFEEKRRSQELIERKRNILQNGEE